MSDLIARGMANNAKLVGYRNPLQQASRTLREPPNFVKYANNPVFTQSQCSWLVSSSLNLYYCAVIDAQSILGASALDHFYMYYSPNHASDTRLGLATAPHPLGPWTDQGVVYTDSASGYNQIENVSVLFNTNTNLFHLYYKRMTSSGAAAQRVCLATSADGRTGWTTYHDVIGVDNKSTLVMGYPFPGDFFVGYPRVFQIAGTFVCTHLMGGASYPYFGVSYSLDGINWQTDPRSITGFNDATTDTVNKHVEFSGFCPFSWRGEVWGVWTTMSFISGTGQSGKSIQVGKLIDIRAPYHTYPAISPANPSDTLGQSWEDTCQFPWILEYQGNLYMFYHSDTPSATGAIGVAIAEVN